MVEQLALRDWILCSLITCNPETKQHSSFRKHKIHLHRKKISREPFHW
jgi:hypothetical protein